MTARSTLELQVRLPKTTAGPAELLALLEQHQIPTLTHNCIADHDELVVLVTTSRPDEAQQVFDSAGYRCQARNVVLLGPTTYRPGMIAMLLKKLAEHGVEIRYSYMSSIAPDHCFVVVETSNHERTLEIITTAY